MHVQSQSYGPSLQADCQVAEISFRRKTKVSDPQYKPYFIWCKFQESCSQLFLKGC